MRARIFSVSHREIIFDFRFARGAATEPKSNGMRLTIV
jgi:hypothetical protein